QTRYSVIILVILAGGKTSSGFLANKTFPVSASTKIADWASRSSVFAYVTFACPNKDAIITKVTKKNDTILLILFFTFSTSTFVNIINFIETLVIEQM